VSDGAGAKDARDAPDEEGVPRDFVAGLGDVERRALLAWVGENLSQVRQSVYGERILHWTLGIGFGIGLAAYVAGYALKSSVTTEPLGFLGDLLYTFGWALWTGVVVVLFLQIVPEVKRRQFKQALDAYEGAVRAEAEAGGDEGPRGDPAPPASDGPDTKGEPKPERPS
jgi:hypothetical protein